jgi:hypothetical protein
MSGLDEGTATVEGLVAEVLQFVENPNVQNVRPDNDDSHVFVGWLKGSPHVPKLNFVVNIEAGMLRRVGDELARRGLEVEWGSDGKCAVVLRGDKYAHVHAAGLLRNAARWETSVEEFAADGEIEASRRAVNTVASQMVLYLWHGGSPTDPEFVRLMNFVASETYK